MQHTGRNETHVSNTTCQCVSFIIILVLRDEMIIVLHKLFEFVTRKQQALSKREQEGSTLVAVY
jgi:hypothetical protein